MQCSGCGTINPAQARFCMGCGSKLIQGLVCTTCFSVLPLQARYCTHCGSYVAQGNGAADAATAASSLGIQAGASAHAAPAVALPLPVTPPVMPATPQAAAIPTEAAPSPAATDASVATGIISGELTLGQLPAARPLQAMLPSLQRYLPEALYEPLERRPKPRDLEAVNRHLSELIATCKTYLARPVVLAPQPPGIPAGGMYRGVFIFGDVSGFTPLSEKLKALGQAGAEQITRIINGLFTELVKTLFAHGGTLLKFGGDAMLGLWQAETDQQMAEAGLLAAQTALAMQEVMKQPAFAEIDALGEKRALLIKIGISAGPYFAAHIGTPPSCFKPHGTMAFVTTGETVNQAEEAEGHAHPGQVAVTRSAARLIEGQAGLGPSEREPDENYLRLLDAPALGAGQIVRSDMPEPPPGELMAQITYLVARLDRLTPYLSDELIACIVTNPRQACIPPEHRPVTVMFANYKGISKLIEKHGESDPELIIHQLNNYFVHMASIVEKYEGTLARMDQYAVGDRIVIFFGAPRAHEDDPVRAVYTALEMQTAVKQNFAALRTSSGVFRFEQRIGINTGHLFAGNVGASDLRQEYTLMGDDINMAARLMSNAPWGQIYISKTTKEQVAAFINVEDRGEIKVKGKEIRIPTFSATGRRGEIGRTRGLAHAQALLIGREQPLRLLVERGQLFLRGRGQIASILGNSGLGKSTLLGEFHLWLGQQSASTSVQWAEARALSFSEQMSYWTAAQMMRSLLHLDPNTSPDDVLYALSQAVESLVEDQAMELIPYLAYMMGLELGEEWAWVKQEDPKVRLKQTLWAAAEFVTALAKKQPVVIALDDLHWADEASLTLIAHLLQAADHAPVFFFLVMRALREHESWKLRDRAAGQYPHRYLELMLEPLERPESALLLSKLLPGALFETPCQDEILDKAAGNPFYLEEVVRSLMEGGAVIPHPEKPGEWLVTEKISQIAVPVTLHAAIVSRIDRLTEDARLALQMAAVIGRQFRVELLRHLAHAESEIEMWLAQLERGGLVRPGDLSLDPTFSFPDALVQEVAYDSLLVLNRQQLHRQVAELLETAYPDELDKNIDLLAYHYSHSDNPDKALKYLKEAATRAEARYANATAIGYYRKMLAIQRERNDRPAQANTLYAMGFRAYEIGDYPDARLWLEESVQLHRANHDPKSEGWSALYLGMVDLKQGHYSAAARNHQYALDSARQRGDRFQEGIHLTNLGRTVMRMGNYPRALQLFTESLQVKKSVDDIMGQGFALYYLGLTCIYQQQFAQAEQHLVASLAMWEQVTDELDNLGYKKDAAAGSNGRKPVKKNDRGLAYCYQGLGLLCLARSEFAQAADYLTLAQAGCEKLVLKAELIETLSYLSQARLGLKDIPQALAVSQRAVQLLAEQQDVEEQQAIYFNHFLVLMAADNPAADKYLQKARATVQEQAQQITDEADRQIFLQAARVNQLIQSVE